MGLHLTASPPLSAPAGHAPLLPSAPRRGGEKYGRPAVSLATRRNVAIAAAETSVPVDVAATLICEASLLLDQLGRRRVRSAGAQLDRVARSSRVTRALGAANADYLRALSCRSWRRHSVELEIPVRLLARLGDADERLAHCELLGSAIRWEIGALLSERTMASWGTESVLAGFR